MMSEPKDSSESRTERLLRLWGAAQAAQEAEVGPPPAPPRRAGAIRAAVLRWAPAAAAAGLLAAAAGLYLAGSARSLSRPVAAPAGPSHFDVLEAELAKAQAERNTARRALASAQTDLAAKSTQAGTAERRVGQLQQEAETLGEKLTAATRKIADLSGQVASAAAQGGGAADVLAEWQANKVELAALKQKMAEAAKGQADLEEARRRLAAAEEGAKAERDALADAQRRLKAALAEVGRIRDLHDKAIAARQAAEAEAMEARRRQTAMVEELQRVYLGGAEMDLLRTGEGVAVAAVPLGRAPARGGWPLAVRQAAARRGLLLERCAELRPTARTEPARDLLDKLEVVFIQLDLLDASGPAAAKSFAALVGGGGLMGRMDEVLAMPGESRNVRTWLWEAKLVLMGADRAG